MPKRIPKLGLAILGISIIAVLLCSLWWWSVVSESETLSTQTESDSKVGSDAYAKVSLPSGEPLEQTIKNSTFIFITRYGYTENGRIKSEIVEFIKRDSKSHCFYNIGDIHPGSSIKEPRGNANYGEGAVVFLEGTPAKMKVFFPYENGAIKGLSDMPINVLKGICSRFSDDPNKSTSKTGVVGTESQDSSYENNEFSINDFDIFGVPLGTIIDDASVIIVTRFSRSEDGKMQSIIKQIIKKRTDVEFPYAVGDPQEMTPNTVSHGTTYGDGKVIFFNGSPPVIKYAIIYRENRIEEWGGMHINTLQEFCQKKKMGEKVPGKL